MNHFVGSEGNPNAQLAVVAEKGAYDEVKHHRPMVGTTGSMLRNHISRAGLDAGKGFWQHDPYVKCLSGCDHGRTATNVWLTNAVHNFDDAGANPSSSDLVREQPRLYRELSQLPNLNCILAVGSHALASLSNFKFTDILNRRGSRLISALGIKMVCTLHPSFYVRGEWRYQSIVQFDINRAVEESKTKDLVFKTRDYFIRPESLSEALSWMNELISRPKSLDISFDIETFQGHLGAWYVSCIGFSDHPQRAFCIPIMDRNRRPYWSSLYDEGIIWRKIQEVLALPNRRYITQNGHAFDCWQLYKHHIATPYMANGFDTYSAHSLLAPDLPHDLGFLVSIYTDEPYYKDESGRIENKQFGDIDDDRFWLYNSKDCSLTLEVAYGLMKDLKDVGMYNESRPISLNTPLR